MEIKIAGKDATRFVNYLITNDVAGYGENKMIYGLMLKEDGGVVDDLMVYKFSDEHYLLVVNAANKDKDYEWITGRREGFDVAIEDLSDDYSQLALQGPLAAGVLQGLTEYRLENLKAFDFDVFQSPAANSSFPEAVIPARTVLKFTGLIPIF